MPRPRQLAYVLDGHEVVPAENIEAWARWFRDERNRIVAQTNVSDSVWVSTIFLGLDHNFWGDGPPVVFETMVFGGERDGDQRRYATWAEAELGHMEMVESLEPAHA